MFRPSQKTFSLYFLVDFILIILIFSLSYIFRYNSFNSVLTQINLLKAPNIKEYSFISSLWLIFITISFKIRGLYTTDRRLSIFQETLKVITSIFYTAILMNAVIFFAQYKFISRIIFLESFLMLCVFLSLWRAIKRLILRELIAKGFHNIDVLIIGAGKIGKITLSEIKKNLWWGFRIVGFLDDTVAGSIDGIPVLGKIRDFPSVSKKYFIDEVIITIPSERRVVSELISQAKSLSLGIKVIPENFEEPLPVSDINYLGIIPLLTYKERMSHPAEFAIKRLFDFVFSLIFIIVFFPLLIIIMFLIMIDSEGNILYIQKRMGFKGKIFNFYKFRSMIKGADNLKSSLAKRNESKGEIIFKIRKDPRITRIGRYLRRYSLDELPQLMNVLRGDMSLVGPRPFPVEESQKLEQNNIPRLTVRPGITGLAQIRGRSDLSVYHWVRWDTWYINNWSLGLDLRILWWTIPVVLKGKGAY